MTFTINLPGSTLAVRNAVEAAIDAVFLAYGSPGGTVNLIRSHAFAHGIRPRCRFAGCACAVCGGGKA